MTPEQADRLLATLQVIAEELTIIGTLPELRYTVRATVAVEVAERISAHADIIGDVRADLEDARRGDGPTLTI